MSDRRSSADRRALVALALLVLAGIVLAALTAGETGTRGLVSWPVGLLGASV
jgi:hypothetical protein